MSDLLHTKQRSSTCHQGIVAKALKEIKHKIETHLSIPEDDTTHGFLLMEALEIINKELSR